MAEDDERRTEKPKSECKSNIFKTWGGDTEYPMFVKLLKIPTVGMGSNAVSEQGFSQKLIRKDQSTMLPENSDNILFIGAHASKFPKETFKELQTGRIRYSCCTM